MKGFIINATSVILILVKTMISYADTVPLTVVNNSSKEAVVRVGNAKGQVIRVKPAQIKMLSVEFNYPTAFNMQVASSSTDCNWYSPLTGKQMVRSIKLTMNYDSSNQTKDCLVEWR